MKYKNILQIDDDYDDCDFFSEALEEVSTAAYTAIHNPIHALQQLVNQEVRPDLIFLDINMPIMTGIELLAEIKKKENISHIPIIIFSTSITTEIKNQIKLLGAIDYYIKPNDFSSLKNLLKSLT
ncbi:response regulator [Flavobacterium psychroterrae]|uniref:Response regulator n=1 Tax=Flavobacterium psychroterrae TaxID=2133767 RepID=A0ABS5PBI9_9FLAO|nr:response regulator [Flavobacterium psychroterrae]MBS7231642.1 response regulator [Flavobacterium psychroterrae]